MSGEEGGAIETPEQIGKGPQGEAERWRREFDAARSGAYKRWMNRAKKAVRRYRDEDLANDNGKPARRNAQFNVLWSNIATTAPAVYSRPPVPVVERRFLDKDVVARAASTIMQRSLSFQIEESGLHEVMKQCRLDLQLVAKCSAWVRYSASYERDDRAPKMQGEPDKAKPTEEDDQGAELDSRRVSSEKICIDYCHWADELVSAARYWGEVRWRAKRAPFTRKQLVALSPENGKLVPLQTTRSDKGARDVTDPIKEVIGTADVWQIWDFVERKTLWFCEDFEGPLLKTADDLLELKCFTPSAPPGRATVTNDTYWPIPDYEIYYDQARELDTLTARIAALTRAIKACGVFDNSIPELERLLSENMENRLIGTKNWAKLTQKGGLDGAISLLPIKEFADALTALYLARTQVKQDLYEISGTSDILRGATNPNETAKAQQLKGQYSGMRLQDRREEFNRFVKDTMVIMAEIICGWFDAETIWLMSDFEQWAKEQDLRTWANQRFPQPPAPMMGHNGGPPLDAAAGGMPMMGASMPPAGMARPGGASASTQYPTAGAPQDPLAIPGLEQQSPPPGGMASSPGTPPVQGMPMPAAAQSPQMPPPPPPISPQEAARALFEDALALLRNDKLRSFRIDIETDSTIAQDQQQEKQDRTEFITAVTQFLGQATEMGAAYPQMMPVLGKFLLFGARGFRVGRELESSLEGMISDLEKQARNPKPKPPSPEEIKAKAVEQKAQADQQKAQFDLQADMARMKMEMQAEQQKLEFEREKLSLEREKLMMQIQAEQQKLAMKAQEGQMNLQLKERDGAMQAQQQDRQAVMDERQAQIQGEQMEQQAGFEERKLQRTEEHDEHKLDVAARAAEQKAKQAAKPAPAKASGAR